MVGDMKEINIKLRAKIVSRIEYTKDFTREVYENQEYFIIIVEKNNKKEFSIIPK